MYPEDGLHLCEVRPGVRAGEHLDYEAAETPDVGFARVRGLLDNLGCHPVDGSLEGWAMDLGAREQVCKIISLVQFRVIDGDGRRPGDALSSTFFEMPKSEILIPPLLSTRMLAPLMSRWMISRSWR